MNLSDIEKSVVPEDFREDSIWRELVTRHGAEPFLDLMALAGGAKIYIPTKDAVTRPARLRLSKRRPIK